MPVASPNKVLVPAAEDVGWLLEEAKLNPVDCGLLAPPKTVPLAAPDPPAPPKGFEFWVELPPLPNIFEVGATLVLPNSPEPLEAGGLLVDPNRPPPWLVLLACPNRFELPPVPADPKLNEGGGFPGPDIIDSCRC